MIRIVALSIFCLLASTTDASAQSDADVERATQLYEEAVAKFRDGEPARAAELFRQSYDLVPRPELLYNEAFARARAGDLEAAREVARIALGGQLPADVDAKFRARLLGWRAADRAREAPSTPAPSPVVATTEPQHVLIEEPPPGRAPGAGAGVGRLTSYIVGGLGVAGLVSGAVIELRLQGVTRDLDRARDRAAYDHSLATGRRLQTAGKVSLIAGGALLAAGVVLRLLTPKKSEPQHALVFHF